VPSVTRQAPPRSQQRPPEKARFAAALKATLSLKLIHGRPVVPSPSHPPHHRKSAS